jgi:type II secretory pathway pseudopilin PulG
VRALRSRLRIDAGGEAGLSFVEVLVAMMIFAIIAVSVAFSTISALNFSSDALARQTATNLAASQIDTVRAAANIITYAAPAYPVVVNNRTYTVSTVTKLQASTSGAVGQCISGSGPILYVQVNVTVTWAGIRAGVSPVYADTLVAPSTRVSDANKGVIVVAVTSASGAGNQGVTITAIPSPTNPNGAVAITSTISPTDSRGCSLILNVVPGNYVVSISEPGAGNPSIDGSQSTSPSLAVPVATGGSASAPFQYDQSVLFNLNFASNFTAGAVVRPAGLDVTFTNTYGIYVSNAGAP